MKSTSSIPQKKWMQKLLPLLLLFVVFIFQMFVGCAELTSALQHKPVSEDDVADVVIFSDSSQKTVLATDMNEDMVRLRNRFQPAKGIEYITPKLVGSGIYGSTKKEPFYAQLVKESDSEIDISLDLVNGVTIPELIMQFADPSILNFQYSIDKAVAGSVSIQLTARMKKSEVWRLLERLLWMNQAYISYQDGIVWIRPLTEMTTDHNVGLAGSGSSNVSVRVFRLKTVEAKGVIESLKPFLTKGGFITEIQGHNALLIIDTDNNIEKLEGIIATVDQVSDTDWYRALFPVENVQPTRLNVELEHILTILGFPVSVTTTSTSSTSSGSSNRSATGGNTKFGAIRMVPMNRIQAILVMAATKEAIEEVAQWIRLLDAADHAGQEQVYIYDVVNGKASSLASSLGALFAVEVSTIDAEQVTLSQMSSSSSSSSSGGGSSGTAPTVRGSTGATRANTQSSGSSSTQAARRAAERDLDAGSASVFTIPCVCMADDEYNRMIFRATPQVYAMIKAVLERIDTVAQQVQLQVVVAEITLSEGENLGSQFDVKAGAANFKTQYPNLYSPGTTKTGDDGTVTTTGPTFPDGFSYLLQSDDNNFFINALATKGRVEVLANPTVVVQSHKTARVNVGSEEPYSEGSQTDGTGSFSTVMNTEIKYRSIGVILTVTPRVTRGGLIQLMFKQEVSQISKSTVETTASAMSPSFPIRTIETVMQIRDGARLVVGGLIQTNKSDNVSSLPILANIPVLNFLGGKTEKSNYRTELVVMVTAHIVNEQTPLEETVRSYADAIDMYRREKKTVDRRKFEQTKRIEMRKDAPSIVAPVAQPTALDPNTPIDRDMQKVSSLGFTEEDFEMLKINRPDRSQRVEATTVGGNAVSIDVINTPK